MRHRIKGQRLNRSMGHRNALRRNLITELFRHERIRTTRAKATAIRGGAEKLITLAKRGNAEIPSEIIIAQKKKKKNSIELGDNQNEIGKIVEEYFTGLEEKIISETSARIAQLLSA